MTSTSVQQCHFRVEVDLTLDFYLCPSSRAGPDRFFGLLFVGKRDRRRCGQRLVHLPAPSTSPNPRTSYERARRGRPLWLEEIILAGKVGNGAGKIP